MFLVGCTVALADMRRRFFFVDNLRRQICGETVMACGHFWSLAAASRDCSDPEEAIMQVGGLSLTACRARGRARLLAHGSLTTSPAIRPPPRERPARIYTEAARINGWLPRVMAAVPMPPSALTHRPHPRATPPVAAQSVKGSWLAAQCLRSSARHGRV